MSENRRKTGRSTGQEKNRQGEATNRDKRRPGNIREHDAARLAATLTRRDRQIALDCYEHRVLTTEQIRRLHFTGTRTARTARARLQHLYDLRVLDRFRPLLPRGEGTSQHHWILDTAGAHVVAALLDVDRAELRWSHHAATTIADSQTLDHALAVNDFATRLAEDLRAAGGTLRRWHGERTVRHYLGQAVIPDAYFVIERPDRPPLHLLLELDRGTEDHRHLLEKSHAYADAIPNSPLAKQHPTVLLLVPSDRRARAVATTLSDGPWPIALDSWVPGDESPLAVISRAQNDEPAGALSTR
jgi:hypothetical protein